MNGVLDREPPNLISDPVNMSIWEREIKAAGGGRLPVDDFEKEIPHALSRTAECNHSVLRSRRGRGKGLTA